MSATGNTPGVCLGLPSAWDTDGIDFERLPVLKTIPSYR